MQTQEHDPQTHHDGWEDPLAHFSLPDLDEEQKSEPVQNVYNVYVVKQHPGTDEEAAPLPESEEEIPYPTAPARRPKKRFLPLALLCVVLVSAMTGIMAGILAPLMLAPPVPVTIIPREQIITTTSTMVLVTGTPTGEQTHGRPLANLTTSQAATAPTTGKGHTDAKAAEGTITLYNAAPFSQTIPAGTLLIGSDGVQVVT
jgi:hypothetical protein